MTIIYFILVLGITVLIHELGHFIFAKKAGIHVYEFSIGMGPKLYGFKRKNDETSYSIRLLPIGGYVQMAGEEVEADEEIPVEKRLYAKSWIERFLTIIAGVLFNFIFAFIIFLTIAIFNGAPSYKPYIGTVSENSPAFESGLLENDLIKSINGNKVSSIDKTLLEMQINSGKTLTIKFERNKKSESITIKPKKIVHDNETTYQYGFGLKQTISKNIKDIVSYPFIKIYSLVEQMVNIIFYLITAKLSLTNLAGPVGIFNIVGETAKQGLVNIIYLIGFLSVNVGFINLLPIPAFDGGRLLFLIIEKIKGKPINQKTENIIHAVGFVFLMALMIFITYNDILRLFK